MLDGLAVWGRELARPENERSPSVLQHEAARGRRMADLWEKELDHPLLRGPLDMVQLTLGCALGLEARNPDFRWRPGHPNLDDWYSRVASRASFMATRPPGSS
jgi:glutathione S-transferase